MNTDPEKLRALLDDVLPSSSKHCGPASADVLNMVRHERQRRLRRHSRVGLLMFVLLAAGAVLWNREPPTLAPVVQAPLNPAPMVIHHINDEQLFALLEGTPAALMKLPNGDSRLLVIEPLSPP